MNICLTTRNRALTSIRDVLAAFALLLLASFAPPALAQAAGVSATVTGYTALENRPLTDADRVPLTVTRSDGPNHSEASGDGGRLETYPSQFGFASASSVGFASADPGVLRLFGGVRAVATDYAFPDGIPSAPSGFNVATQVTASASFTDSLTISVAGLATGTLVHVPFHFLAEVQSDLPLGYPPFSVHPVSVYASFEIPGLGPQTFSTESGFFPWTRTTLVNGNGLYVVHSAPFEVDVPVGVALPIGALFSISGLENIGDPNRQTDVSGFADGRNTAALWLGTLADGMTITSASGHDYSVDPTAVVSAPVPEPESYVMLLAGIGVLGFVARRRKPRAPD
jgi:hypothetical protein